MSRFDNDEVVRVATAPNPEIAASWRDLLEDEGIPSMLKIDDALGVAYHVSSLSTVGIFVLKRHAERARQLLDDLMEADVQGEAAENEE